MKDQRCDQKPRIGLALSGGGARAIAFHLGCLRALHELKILSQVRVLSTVSGGSVIGGLYSATEEPFQQFEQQVRDLLRQGITSRVIRVSITTLEGLKAVICWFVVVPTNAFVTIVAWATRLASPVTKLRKSTLLRPHTLHPPVRRFASRTTILRRALDEYVFGGVRLHELPPDKPTLIINATELRTGTAFHFGMDESGCWPYGKLVNNDVSLAHAVTASAAYPLFLPALDEQFVFENRNGETYSERVTLADGGVYDNLGLAPLWPARNPTVSTNVHDIDTIICCRAGYGLRQDPPTQFFIARLKSAYTSTHYRAQNAAMNRLFELKEAGKIRAFVLPYLGQNDDRLAFPPSDLVKKADTDGYPTDFSAMPDHWIDRLSTRGEQLTRALIAEHAPELLTRP